jgi:hypothetical protein
MPADPSFNISVSREKHIRVLSMFRLIYTLLNAMFVVTVGLVEQETVSPLSGE